MSIRATRRAFLKSAVVLPATAACAWSEAAAADEVATIAAGDLKLLLRDNAESPRVLSGIDALFNLRDAPGFDAFDPDSPGASAGMNFEHIIAGHKNEHNAFAPRNGPMAMEVNGQSARLVRKREDDPWQISSSLQYAMAPPHAVDVTFRCVPNDAKIFGQRGYAIFFFANYMNDVQDIAIHFRGIETAGGPEKWIAADAPRGPADWNQGGTYRSVPAGDLQYDADHNFKLNNWSYDYPRISEPFYYGRAAHGMAFILMFDKLYSEHDEVRFSLFKFKTPKFPRPAWDFQYVIRRIEPEKEYGFRARLVWKKFVSADDCRQEFLNWRAGLR